LVVAAGTASADTGDGSGSKDKSSAGASAPGDLAPAGDLTPAGVPVLGLVQATVGATKALPGQSGQGY
jgi:hypothetical protein